MKILLLAATVNEIKPFINELRKSDRRLHLSVLVGGIGSISTSYHLLKQVSLDRPDLIIQAGIAGSFTKLHNPGSLVVVKRDRAADLGVLEKKQWMTMHDLGLEKQSSFPFRKGWLVNPYGKVLSQTSLPQVSAVSVNEITTRKQSINLFAENFGAVVESMEGAAFHYVCLMEKIPFLQLRAVSNFIGERDKKKWKMKAAITNLNSFLIEMLLENDFQPQIK